MKVELEIREILRRRISTEKKAELICKFMTWNKERLIRAIRENGTSSNEQINNIIRTFWS